MSHDGVPFVAHVITDPGHRNRGIASALLQSTGRTLADLAEERVDLAVSPANLTALNLYARMGFAACADSGTFACGGIQYRTEAACADVSVEILRCVHELDLAMSYRIESASALATVVSVGPNEPLAARLLALVVGHRRGSSTYSIDRRTLEAVIGLLEPAALLPAYGQVLCAWRSLRDSTSSEAVFTIEFS